MQIVIDIPKEYYKAIMEIPVNQSTADMLIIANGKPLDTVLDEIRTEIEQLPTKTRTNWDGCCPDIDYPEIEYVDVTKAKLLEIIDKHMAESEDDKCSKL